MSFSFGSFTINIQNFLNLQIIKTQMTVTKKGQLPLEVIYTSHFVENKS